VFVNLGFQSMEGSNGFGIVLLNSKAKGSSNLRLEQSGIKVICMIEISLYLVQLLLIILAETTVEDDEGARLRSWVDSVETGRIVRDRDNRSEWSR
jgi:hypothetical protein